VPHVKSIAVPHVKSITVAHMKSLQWHMWYLLQCKMCSLS